MLETSAAADPCLQLQTQLRELQEQAQKLQKETEYLRAQAAEYQSLKDHIADIEISAHRRTEEFRAQTIQRIHELVAQQRAWCSENSVRYEKLLQSFGEKLQAARDVLRETDLSGFEEMLCSLDRLDEELDK